MDHLVNILDDLFKRKTKEFLAKTKEKESKKDSQQTTDG